MFRETTTLFNTGELIYFKVDEQKEQMGQTGWYFLIA
jgi:hypothetical protein